MPTTRFIDIQIRSGTAERAIATLERKMRGLGGVSDRTVRILGNLTKVAAGVATAILGAATATGAMVLASANARRETEQLARLVKVSAEEFNALAFATSQFGVNAEQIADISKDVGEKVAEFATAATGPFQDYVDILKLSKTEAIEAAKAFQFMSGPEVLAAMVKEMEAAGATAGQMSFALESVGNDATKLIPLFSNNASELKRLTQGFNTLNSELTITDQQSDELRKVSENFDLLSTRASAASTAISATLAPVLNQLFDDIIENAPDAALAMIDFLNSFKDPAAINSIAAVDRQIQDLQASILDMRDGVAFDLGLVPEELIIKQTETINAQIDALVKRRQELAATPAGVTDIGGTGGAGATVGEDENQKKTDTLLKFFSLERAASEKHLQDLFDIEIGFKTAAEVDEENRFLANQQRLITRRDAALIAIGEDETTKALLRTEFTDAELAAVAEHEALLTQIQADEAALRKQITTDQFTSQLSITANALNSFAALSDKDNKKQKKFQKAAIIANTAVAVVKSYNNGGGYPWGIPPAIAMGLAGAAQLRKLGGAGGGGEVVPSGGGGAPLTNIPGNAAAGPTAAAQNLQVQQRVVDIRIDDNALLTGSMFKEAINSVLESDSDVVVNITNQQDEARRTGAL